MAKIQGPKEGKSILIFRKKSGPNLGLWAQKSTLRLIRILGPSSAALAQSSLSLLLMALVTGPFLGRIASLSKVNLDDKEANFPTHSTHVVHHFLATKIFFLNTSTWYKLNLIGGMRRDIRSFNLFTTTLVITL